MISLDQIKKEFPLHFYVWNNDYNELEEILAKNQFDIEKLDPRGRTPLMLAVKLSHFECVKVLLAAKSDVNIECDGWSVVQEAVCGGDPNILTAILEVRDLQRHVKRVSHVPLLLQRLQEAPDFYVEMKWEFTSWVPLLSRVCPSDTYKVYKRGSNVRIDTTLLGFDNTKWQRGNRSYIFKGQTDTATMIEVDHDSGEVSIEVMRNLEQEMSSISGIAPTREAINLRLQSPVISNNIDMDKISFERNKSGFWGWRSEKNEIINGYDCKVYGANNVEFVTRQRNDHLNDEQIRMKNSRTPLQHFLGMAEDDYDHQAANDSGEQQLLPGSRKNSLGEINAAAGLSASSSPTATTPVAAENAPTIEEYFSDIDLNGRDIGRPKKLSTKVQRFKANLWLSEEFPIKLQEQVLPILDLMSTMASPHVNKLKGFITMQLPSGFPIKIEIPLFHVMNAVVTFGNVFALETPVANVSNLKESDERVTCVIDDSCFDIPANYIRKGGDYRRQLVSTFDDEDELMQFAIQQSLIESGSENDEVDIWEALRQQRPLTPTYYNDEQFQRALQESLLNIGYYETSNASGETRTGSEIANQLSDYLDTNTSDLELAIKLSQEDERRREEELQREQEMLEQVLRLSLEEK
uniref:Putative ankyrin repeat protein n=1 Tax=Corethrella appendiculata TaxID=1370023 RepID=U5EZR6_9DIPT